MAYTDFFCDASTGANVNGGSDAGSPSMSDTAGTGAVSTVTHQYTSVATNGSVGAGQAISIYSGSATVAAFTAMITTVTGGSGSAWVITYDPSRSAGTEPTTGATYKAKVGGAWKGPNAAEQFPFGYVKAALTDVTGNPPMVNLKNNATYNITASIAGTCQPGVTYQGYTTAVRDGGFATIDGGTSGASYILLDMSSGSFGGYQVNYLIFQNNGATGIADGVLLTNNIGGQGAFKCVVHDVRGSGFSSSSGSAGLAIISECEAYNCNQSNTAGAGGVSVSSGGQVNNSFSHDNTGVGFKTVNGIFGPGNIADSNTSHGFSCADNYFFGAESCEAYNNGGSGFKFSTTVGYNYSVNLRNCNMLKNGAYAFDMGSGFVTGVMANCGLGSGSQANTSGKFSSSLPSVQEIGTVTYASGVTPWVDPANGDFRINLAAAKGTGLGSFTQTAASYAGTVGYPDIGAAQHLESPASTIEISTNLVNIVAGRRASVPY